jgi:hypothetical protein
MNNVNIALTAEQIAYLVAVLNSADARQIARNEFDDVELRFGLVDMMAEALDNVRASQE